MKRLVCVSLAALALGCPSSAPEDASPEVDAGVDAALDAPTIREDVRPDAALPAPTDAPFKGPWVMRPTTSRVVVRWETRLPITMPTVVFTEETTPGPERRTSGTSTRAEVQLSHGIGIRGITEPDVPGTYYLNEVDVSGLAVNESIHVSDLVLAPGLTIKTEGSLAVASVVLPAAEEVAEPVAAEGAVAEGEAAAAPGAEGAAAGKTDAKAGPKAEDKGGKGGDKKK